MTIDELYLTGKISARALNVCKYNNLNNLCDIISYYNLYGSFINLRNCGRKTNEELFNTCIKNSLNYQLYIKENTTSLDNSLDETKPLNRIQREIINSFIEISINKLNNRSRNAIISYLDGNLKIRNIFEKILINSHFDVSNIKNVGKRTASDLTEFLDSLARLVANIAHLEDDHELMILRNKVVVEKMFPLLSIPNEVVESQSIFKLVDFLIPCGQIFGGKENIVFQNRFKLYLEQLTVSIEVMANNLGLSRERIRQIQNNILEELTLKLQFIVNINDDLHQKYDIDITRDLIFVDDSLCQQINLANNTCFTSEFIAILIHIYHSNAFELIGIKEDVFLSKQSKAKERHNWQHLYLVRKDISNKFNFIGFIDDLEARLLSKIEETYTFNFKSYLLNFLKAAQPTDIDDIANVSEFILNKELDFTIDINDNVVFQRNTLKQLPEYVIEVLEESGRPSKIEEIYYIFITKYPDITTSLNSIRSSLQRSPEIIYFGRSSTYGLKKWENEKAGIKGGTIKDIIYDYLKNNLQPVHILELVKEVHVYRDKTNAKNIMTNLKLDPYNQFVIYNQNFIGLSNVYYNSKLTNLPKFLGKTISKYIRQNSGVNRFNVEKYFAKQLDISHESMQYIIELLILNNYIEVDNQNNLYI